MDYFLLAIQFLTRIPVRYRVSASGPALGRSALYYPLVGLLIGVLLNVVALASTAVGAEPAAAALVLMVWVLLTGGLHLDGLADCADAWAGGLGDKERSLRIMKDSAVGAIAVVVLVMVLLLKWCAIWVLMVQHNLIVLMLVPVLGRTAILLLMLSTPYCSPQGLAEKLLEHLPTYEARWVVVVSLFFAGMFLGWANVLVAGGILLWVRYATMERLGGATGDVYGAAVELVETAALLAVALW